MGTLPSRTLREDLRCSGDSAVWLPCSSSPLEHWGRQPAFDEFRRRKRLDPDGHLLADIPTREDSAEGRLDVQAVMERLPPPDREVLYLFEIAGFTTDEIGTVLGVRGSAIRQRLKRARDRFRALYDWTSD